MLSTWPKAYDRLLVTCSISTSRDHKPDEYYFSMTICYALYN